MTIPFKGVHIWSSLGSRGGAAEVGVFFPLCDTIFAAAFTADFCLRLPTRFVMKREGREADGDRILDNKQGWGAVVIFPLLLLQKLV